MKLLQVMIAGVALSISQSVFAGASEDVVKLNTDTQAQLKEIQKKQQDALKAMNVSTQTQLKEIQAQLKEIQTKIQAELKDNLTKIQDQIKAVQAKTTAEMAAATKQNQDDIKALQTSFGEKVKELQGAAKAEDAEAKKKS